MIVTNFGLIGRVFPSKYTIYRKKKIKFFSVVNFLNSERTTCIWLDVATRFRIDQTKSVQLGSEVIINTAVMVKKPQL